MVMSLKRVVDWTVRITVVVGLVISGFLYTDYQDFVECQAEYSNNLNIRTRTLAEANQSVANSLDRIEVTSGILWDAVAANTAKPGSVPREQVLENFNNYRQAIRDYNTSRTEFKERQAQYPLPPPPEETCG